MNTSLIRYFNRDTKISKHFLSDALRFSLSMFTQIMWIKVEDVIVLDTSARFTPALDIPNCLEQAPSYKPSIWQVKRTPTRQYCRIDGVRFDVPEKCGSHDA